MSHHIPRALLSRTASSLLALGAMAAVSPAFAAPPQSPRSVTKQSAATRNTTTFSDSVPAAVANARKLRALAPQQTITVLVCFQFADMQAAEAYANAVSDPNSLLYGQWLTPQEVGQKFGPVQADYDAMLMHLQASGLRIVETPVNRLTISASGTPAQLQAAFGVQLNEYQESAQDAARRNPNAAPTTFFASATPVTLPARFAQKVTSVEGLETYTRPVPRLKKGGVAGPFDMSAVRTAYNLAPIYSQFSSPTNTQGANRTIGISNWDGVDPVTNAPLFIDRNTLPYPAGGKGSNIQRVLASGVSSGTNGVGEGDLDFQMAMGMAPLATIIIYDGGTSTSSPVAVLTREASDNKADIITESYGWPLSGSTITAAHTQHTVMTMQGQTYLLASGDLGNIIDDGNEYPDYEPDVINVGGTALTINTGTNTFASEIAWRDSGGGYSNNSAAFNVRPAYQVGRNVATAVNKRYVPDIALHSAGSQTGTSNSYRFYVSSLTTGAGTSFASPIAAGSLALVEQYLIGQGYLTANAAGKYRLGRLLDRLYAFNGRNDIYNDVKTGYSYGTPQLNAGPYWDQSTGWGSVNWFNLAVAMMNPLSVTVSPATASLNPGQAVNLTAAVVGSTTTGVTWAVTSGPGTISTSGVYTAPATIATTTTVTVTATSVLDTANAGTTTASFQANPVFGTAAINLAPSATTISGTIALDAIPNPGATLVPTGTFTFTLTPTSGGSPIVKTSALGAGGAFTLTGIPANNYTLTVQGAKWLREATSVNTMGGNVSGASLSLPGGDANGDNTIDVADFGLLVNAYNGNTNIPDSGYDISADFNCDGIVDVGDFGVLVNNYNTSGAP